MPDWTGSRPHPETPADTAPDLPTPLTPGWSQWLQEQANRLKEIAGRADNPDGVTMQVTRGWEKFWYGAEGATPGPWQKEGPYAEVQRPEYADFTMFSRLYPGITLREYIEVRVKVTFHFSNPEATWEKEFLMYERTGETRERTNHKIYRWEKTSFEYEENGVTVRYKDDSGPSNESVVPHIKYDEVYHYPDYPPPHMLPKPKPPAAPPSEGELFFVADVDGWRIASENARFASSQIGWTRFAGAQQQGGGRGGRKSA